MQKKNTAWRKYETKKETKTNRAGEKKTPLGNQKHARNSRGEVEMKILYVILCVILFGSGFKFGKEIGSIDYKEHTDKIYDQQLSLKSHEKKMMEFNEEMLKFNEELEQIKKVVGPFADDFPLEFNLNKHNGTLTSDTLEYIGPTLYDKNGE